MKRTLPISLDMLKQLLVTYCIAFALLTHGSLFLQHVLDRAGISEFFIFCLSGLFTLIRFVNELMHRTDLDAMSK